MKNNNTRFIPFLLAICLIAGIAIGTFYANHFSGNKLGIINTSSNKLNALLRIINDQYVDTVNMGELVEEAMPQILSELDPHSSYIPAKDLEAVNADLKGSFSGIGIQFTIQNDTIHVNSVIQGGPSEKVGLMAGDRIVEVDDSAFVGKIVTNSEAMKRLKGEKGSKVKLGVYRPGEKDLPSPTRASTVSSPAPPTNWRILARTVTRALAINWIPSLATAVTGGVSMTFGLTDICTASNTSRPARSIPVAIWKDRSILAFDADTSACTTFSTCPPAM